MFQDEPAIWLLLLAFPLKAAGFVVRDELYLRLLVGTGLALDTAYFLFRTDPVLPSAYSAGLLVLINLVLVVIIMRERSTFGMAPRDKRMFTKFGTLTPGQFRRVNAVARWHVAAKDTEILVEGEEKPSLYFIDEAAFTITKQGEDYMASGPAFAGEVMFLRGGVSSASVVLSKGTVYAEWSTEDLRRLMRRSLPLKNALTARFSLDMADKVAKSVPMVMA